MLGIGGAHYAQEYGIPLGLDWREVSAIEKDPFGGSTSEEGGGNWIGHP
jgi:hypothetical protein